MTNVTMIIIGIGIGFVILFVWAWYSVKRDDATFDTSNTKKKIKKPEAEKVLHEETVKVKEKKNDDLTAYWLNKDLNEAIEKEDYETAAKLRDKLNELEKKKNK